MLTNRTFSNMFSPDTDRFPANRQVAADIDQVSPGSHLDDNGNESIPERCPHCGAPVAEEGCSNGLCEAVN